MKPKKRCKSSFVTGVGIILMSLTLAGSGMIPWSVYMFPKKSIDVFLIKRLSDLKTRPLCFALCTTAWLDFDRVLLRSPRRHTRLQ